MGGEIATVGDGVRPEGTLHVLLVFELSVGRGAVKELIENAAKGPDVDLEGAVLLLGDDLKFRERMEGG